MKNISNEDLEFFEKCSKLEGTELGEYWSGLLYMYRVVDYGQCETFKKELVIQIQKEIKYLKENTKIETTTENIPQTFEELIFLDN